MGSNSQGIRAGSAPPNVIVVNSVIYPLVVTRRYSCGPRYDLRFAAVTVMTLAASDAAAACPRSKSVTTCSRHASISWHAAPTERLEHIFSSWRVEAVEELRGWRGECSDVFIGQIWRGHRVQAAQAGGEWLFADTEWTSAIELAKELRDVFHGLKQVNR